MRGVTGLEAVGFDGDDTLWQSETAFHVVHAQVRQLLAAHVDAATLDARLLDVERSNLALYGYGAKAFTLSLIETAIDIAGDDLSVADVKALLDLGKELLAHPVDLLPGARAAVESASAAGLTVLLVTKGDLFHQESKVARSGFGDLVDGIEVVAEKDTATYERVLRRHGLEPGGFCMVGNSLKSDAAPVLGLGGWAVHVPHELTWALEHPDEEGSIRAHPRFREVGSLVDLPPLLADLGN
jgi:putative hydrolase of the HAD superfamily